MAKTILVLLLVVVTMLGVAASLKTKIDLVQLKKMHSSRHFDEVNLPSGLTHYQSIGSGPSVILIHGVSGPLTVWDKTVVALTDAGYRVVRYDLFGRGFSQRLENSPYDIEIYVRQLEDLMAKLEVAVKVRLVGSSFGAVIASEFALRHSERIEGLVLIGPAGFPITVPVMARLGELPVFGELLKLFLAYKVILKQNDHYFVSGRMPEELRSFVADQLAVDGTTQAILQTMRNSPVQKFVASYAKLKSLRIPIGVIWGRQDQTFPYQNSAILLKAAPQAKLVTIENSGHLPQYERAIEATPALINFLRFDKGE